MAKEYISTQIHPIDFEKNIAVGIKLPLIESENSFFQLNYSIFEQAKSNLKNLLLTERGERVMIPSYGTSLKKFLFEAYNSGDLSGIKIEIETTVNRWLPYIKIIDLNLYEDANDSHRVLIELKFSLSYDPSTVDFLKFDYYLR